MQIENRVEPLFSLYKMGWWAFDVKKKRTGIKDFNAKKTVLVSRDEWESFLSAVRNLIDVHLKQNKFPIQMENVKNLQLNKEETPPSGLNICVGCGQDILLTDNFCYSCGRKTSLDSNVCIVCGRNFLLNDKFCDNCGRRVSWKLIACLECGRDILDGDRYCDNCGGQVTA